MLLLSGFLMISILFFLLSRIPPSWLMDEGDSPTLENSPVSPLSDLFFSLSCGNSFRSETVPKRNAAAFFLLAGLPLGFVLFFGRASFSLPRFLFLFCLFFLLAYTDMLRKILPDPLLFLLGILFLFHAGIGNCLSALLLFGISALLFLPGFLGFGDAKLFLVLGLSFSSPRNALSFFLASFLLNGLICVLLLLLRCIKKTDTFPMAPAIFLSYFLFLSEESFGLYLLR